MRGGVGYKDARMCRRVERDSDAPRRATGGAVEQSGLIEACITPPIQRRWCYQSLFDRDQRRLRPLRAISLAA
jgi:hypothetical protein